MINIFGKKEKKPVESPFTDLKISELLKPEPKHSDLKEMETLINMLGFWYNYRNKKMQVQFWKTISERAEEHAIRISNLIDEP